MLVAAGPLVAPGAARAAPRRLLSAREEPFHHGVCFAHAWRDGARTGYGTEVGRASLARLRDLGVDSISLTPFGFQPTLEGEVRLATALPGGETDAAVAGAARQARALGMRVMLKPHVWVHGGAWIGDQRFASDAAFDRWFESYRAFIVHYARLAEAEQMEWLVLGTELKGASRRAPARWRALVGELRALYHGRLTYAANWDEEEVPFWDLLDAVGVQAYAPVATREGAGLDELRAGWRRVIAHLEALSARTGKPILITEVGYRATADAGIRPSAWPEASAARFDGEQQARCTRAALEALTASPACRGVYLWKWFSDSRDEAGPIDFSPAGKPAEAVLRELYRAAGARPSPGRARDQGLTKPLRSTTVSGASSP